GGGLFLPPLGHPRHSSENAPSSCQGSSLPCQLFLRAARPSVRHHTHWPVCSSPATDGDAPHCRSRSNAPARLPAPAPSHSHAGRCPRTSPYATAVPQTRCPDPVLSHQCSPPHRRTRADP